MLRIDSGDLAGTQDDDQVHISTSGTIPPELAVPSFRFSLREPIPCAQDILEGSDAQTFWRITLLLVVWLHLTYHLPYRACDLVLRVLRLVFSLLDSSLLDDDHVLTLTSAFRRFHLEDSFLELPMCPKCGKIAPPDTAKGSVCSVCSGPLFGSSTSTSRSSGLGLKPLLRLPFNPLSQQLTDLLNREGMEEAIDAWRYRERKDGIMLDIMDGKVWRTLPGPDGLPFFDNDLERRSKDELRIGVTMGFDG